MSTAAPTNSRDRWVAKMRAEGRCVHCGKPAAIRRIGARVLSTSCAEHQAKSANYSAARRKAGT